MKKKLVLVLAFAALSLVACEEDYEVLNPGLDPGEVSNTLTITAFYPESAACGTAVSIFGRNFGPSMSDNYVTFNGVPAEVTQVLMTKDLTGVVVLVPANLPPDNYMINLSAHGQTTTFTKACKVN